MKIIDERETQNNNNNSKKNKEKNKGTEAIVKGSELTDLFVFKLGFRQLICKEFRVSCIDYLKRIIRVKACCGGVCRY